MFSFSNQTVGNTVFDLTLSGWLFSKQWQDWERLWLSMVFQNVKIQNTITPLCCKKTCRSRLAVYTLVIVQDTIASILWHYIKKIYIQEVVLVPKYCITVLPKLGTAGRNRWYTNRNPGGIHISCTKKGANVIKHRPLKISWHFLTR